jgi:lipopolysaccharide export system permease protein
MKKIDRYILGKYMSSFFFCLLLFTVIVVVIDISEKTDDFVKSNLSTWDIIRLHYFGFIPRIDAMLFPLFVFISVIFFTSKMAGRSEIIAILSSGVSFARFVLPYMIGGIFLAGILWGAYQYIVPQANRTWSEFEKRYVDVNSAATSNSTSYKQNIYFKLDAESYVGIKGYDTITKTGTGFFLQKFKSNRIYYNLRATNFNWDSSAKKWHLANVFVREMQDINEKITAIPAMNANYNFKPIDLRKDDYLKDQMSTPDLKNFIRMEKQRGSEMINTLLVERYSRDAIPFSVIILTLIGVSLASRKVRGGSGAHLALGVVISVVYILFSRITVVFATKGNFTPWLAAWLPTIIFGLLALYLFRRASR